MDLKFHDRFINITEEKNRRWCFRFDNCFICSAEKRGMGLVGVLNKVKILIFPICLFIEKRILCPVECDAGTLFGYYSTLMNQSLFQDFMELSAIPWSQSF